MRFLPKRLKVPSKKVLAAILIVILVAAAIFLKSRAGSTTPVQYATVTRQSITQSVTESGVLAGVNTANLKFETAGKVSSVPVKVGDTVNAGTLIASLDTTQLQIALTQAQNNLRQADATLADTYDQVQGHTTDETFAMRDVRTKAEVAHDNAYQAVLDAQQAFNGALIYAPFSGTVTQVNVYPNQVASPVDIAAQIVDTSQIYFDADVDESDLANISVGQNANVTLNAYPNQTFTGTVAEILPQTHDTTSGATVVTARINLGNPNITFAAGLNGQADFIQQQHQDVLTVPIEAVQDDNTVIVKRGKAFLIVPVKVGVESDTEAEITSGLTEGEQVVTNPQAVAKQAKKA